MATTNSLSFPNMFDPIRNKVSVLEDNESVINRTKLLLLVQPTELYNNIDFGAGLKRFMFTYNNPNNIAMIQDAIKKQLDKYEPCVIAEDTKFHDLISESKNDMEIETQQFNEVHMSVGLSCTFVNKLEVEIDGQF